MFLKRDSELIKKVKKFFSVFDDGDLGPYAKWLKNFPEFWQHVVKCYVCKCFLEHSDGKPVIHHYFSVTLTPFRETNFYCKKCEPPYDKIEISKTGKKRYFKHIKGVDSQVETDEGGSEVKDVS